MGVTKLKKLITATEDDPDNLDKWFELGKYATDRFIVGIGEDALTKVAQERPDDAIVLGLLAKALNRRRKLVESEKIYLRALEIEPDNLELLTGLAVVYGNQGEMEKAIPAYKRAIAVDVGYPWTVHGYVHILESLGRTNEIIPVLERALKVNPDSALICILYSIELRKSGKQSLAEEYMTKGLDLLDKVDCEEQSRAVRMLMNLGPRLGPAFVIEHGSRLLQKDPDNLDIQLFVCVARSMTEPQSAIAELRRLLDNDPNNPRIIGMLLGALHQVGDIEGMLVLKSRLETVAPEDTLMDVVNMVLVREKPVDLLVSQQDRDQFVESTRAILRRFPASPQGNFMYIHALKISNKFDEAKEHALKAIDIIKIHDIREHLFFALLLRDLGLHEQSKAQYQAAANIVDSPFGNLLIQLAEHIENENYPEIVRTCKEFIKQNQATPELYSILGRVQHYTNQDEARITLQMGADLGNHDAIILLSSLLDREGEEQKANNLLQQLVSSKEVQGITRARCLAGLKQFDEASDILKKFLEKQPGNYLAWYLLALIKKRDSKDEVKSVLKTMFESGIHDKGSSDPDKLYQKLETDKAVDAFANEIMMGELGGKVKHMLLKDQVMSLLSAEFEEGAK